MQVQDDARLTTHLQLTFNTNSIHYQHFVLQDNVHWYRWLRNRNWTSAVKYTLTKDQSWSNMEPLAGQLKMKAPAVKTNERWALRSEQRDLVSFHAVLFSSAWYTLGNLVPAISDTGGIQAHRLLQQFLFVRSPRRWIAANVVYLRLCSRCNTTTNATRRWLYSFLLLFILSM